MQYQKTWQAFEPKQLYDGTQCQMAGNATLIMAIVRLSVSERTKHRHDGCRSESQSGLPFPPSCDESNRSGHHISPNHTQITSTVHN